MKSIAYIITLLAIAVVVWLGREVWRGIIKPLIKYMQNGKNN